MDQEPSRDAENREVNNEKKDTDEESSSDADKRDVSEDNPVERLTNSMEALLASIESEYVQGRSIPIVPDILKKSSEDAYMPKVVSIGPRFRGTRKELLSMEVIKLRCLSSLLYRTNNKASLKECSEAILQLDELVRASYVDDIKFDRCELAQIMLLDGGFLLELLISRSNVFNEKLKSSYPGPGAQVGKMEKVLSDLTVLENQIPLVILKKLSATLFPDVFTLENDNSIADIDNLALSLSGYSTVSSLNDSTNAAHFLEIVHLSIPGKGKIVEHKRKYRSNTGEIQESQQHYSIDFKSEEAEEKREALKLKRCATRLKAAGITIKPPDSKLVQRFVNMQWNCFGRMLMRLITRKQVNNPAAAVSTFNFDIRFSKGKLEIPPLHITETTEAKWKNFIAWEHHKMSWKSFSTDKDQGLSSKFPSSALFFNGLICCATDVQLLKDRKVIVDHVNKSNEELVTFFRTITMGVDHGIVESSYVKMCDHLNTYSSLNSVTQIHVIVWHYCRRFLQWLFKFLKRDYNFVAAVVPVLTIVQVVYAVLTYHDTK